MTDSTDQRNWIERLSSKIPGYSGYVDRERRRDIDKLHREHLADRIRSLKPTLTEVMRELTNGGRLFEVGPVEQAIKKLDHSRIASGSQAMDMRDSSTSSKSSSRSWIRFTNSILHWLRTSTRLKRSSLS